MQLENDPRLKRVGKEIFAKSFVSSPFNERRLSVAYYFRPDDGHLLADVHTDEYASGPPGLVHGGAIAAMLDEAMGIAAWFNRHPVVTANLNVNFDRPLPVGQDVIIDNWVEEVQDKKVFVRGEIRAGDTVYARANGLFIRLPLDDYNQGRIDRLLASAL